MPRIADDVAVLDRNLEAPLIESIPPILERAEIIQNKIAPYFPHVSLEAENYLRAIPAATQEKAMTIMDDICREVGQPTLSRRILSRNYRIAAAVETHIFTKKNREFEKKYKIDGNVDDQKGIKNSQALATGSGGIATLAFSVLGAVLPSPYGELFRNLSNLPDHAVRTYTTIKEGDLAKLSNDQSFFLNTVQAERQSTEGLKGVTEQLRQLILELMRLEMRSIESISQR